MPGVEFVDPGPAGPDDESGPGRPRHAAPRGRGRPVALVLAGLVAAGLAAYVAVRTGGGDEAAISSSSSSSSASSTSTSPSVSSSTPVLVLPALGAFGSRTIALQVADNLVYGLTRQLVGVGNRAGGQLTVRPAPLGLIAARIRPQLLLDRPAAVLWVVGVGGTAIGGYDPQHLDSLSDVTMPRVITGAAAMDGRLWVATGAGLYVVNRRGAVARVGGTDLPLRSVAADPAQHTVLALGGRGRQWLFRWAGGRLTERRPAPAGARALAVTGGRIWLSVGTDPGTPPVPALVRLDPRTLFIADISPVPGAASLVAATYGDRLVVRGAPNGRVAYCIAADTGHVLQRWDAPPGAVALNQLGLLVVSRRAGVEALGADGCLTGSG